MKKLGLLLFFLIPFSAWAQEFPFLKVGNTWEYMYINEETGEEVPVIITIIGQQDDEFEITETRGKKGKDVTQSIWFVDNGFLKEYKKGGSRESSWNIMKSNPEIGDKWEANLGFERIVFEVSILDKVVYTKAGRFEAYEVLVKSASGSVLYTTYFNNNVGPLRGSSAFNRGELVSINF
jgi:hypothetical protein